MARGRPAPGVSVRISPATHARVVLACETLRISVPDFMERAALASLARQEQEMRIKAYKLACSAAEAALTLTPLPRDYGLPDNFTLSLRPGQP